jgi:hypothetical protein
MGRIGPERRRILDRPAWQSAQEGALVPIKLIHSTGLKGLFRQSGVGAITLGFPHNPRAFYLYREVRFDGKRPEYLEGAACIEAPLGDLPDLPVGILLRSDLAIESPDSLEFSIKIAFHQKSARSATRKELEADGLLPWMDDHPAVVASRVSEAYWYVCDCLDGRFNKILFPATAIFTAYYAPTSRLASRILAGDINDLEGNFVNKRKTKAIDSNGLAVITFRAGVLTAEALTLSRAWYDKTFRSRLEDIHRHSALNKRSNQPTFLRCEPPSEGEIGLRVEGMVRSRDDGGRPDLIVLRIAASDEAMPFRTLEAHMDQTTGSPTVAAKPDDPEGMGGRSTPPVDFADLFLPLNGQNTPPGTAPPLVVSLSIPATQFSALGDDDIRIIRRKSKRAGKGKGQIPPTPTDTNSTGRGNSGGDEEKQQTELTSPGQGKLDPDDQTKERSPMEALESVLAATDVLQDEYGISIAARRVTTEGKEFNGMPVNQVSTEIKDRSDKWVYIYEKKLARPILILEASKAGKFIYLLEIVRDEHDEFSTLTFCRMDRCRMEDEALRNVFDLVDHLQRLPPNLALRAKIGEQGPDETGESAASRAEAVRVKHSYGDPAALAHRLGVLLIYAN